MAYRRVRDIHSVYICSLREMVNVRLQHRRYHHQDDEITMMELINRVFTRIFRSLLSYYGPAVLTIMFSFALLNFFPEGPLWPIPVFLVFSIVFVKW